MTSLRGKTAVITGASGGIGRATAIMFAQAGADVLVHYHVNRQAAAEVAREVETHGATSRICAADLAHREQAERMIDFAVGEFGKLDILVNNAGLWEEAAIERLTEEQLRRTIAVNLNGVFYATGAASRQMMARKSGNIINIASTAGQRGEPLHSPYAATKGAIISMTKSWAVELIPHNIRVNCVAPGWVDTDMSRPALNSEEKEEVLRTIPLGRVGTPEEIAGCVLFLASDLSTFVVGEILNANGGAVLCG